MKITYYFLAVLLCTTLGLNAQQQDGKVGPTYVGTATTHTYVPSLASRINGYLECSMLLPSYHDKLHR